MNKRIMSDDKSKKELKVKGWVNKQNKCTNELTNEQTREREKREND